MTAPWMRTRKRPRSVETPSSYLGGVTPHPVPSAEPGSLYDQAADRANDRDVAAPQQVARGNPADDPTRCCDHSDLITELIGQVRVLSAQVKAALAEMGATP